MRASAQAGVGPHPQLPPPHRELIPTVQVADVNPGTPGSRPRGFVGFGGKVFFSSVAPDSGLELWSTDGTAAGTALFKDFAAGTASSNPTWLTLSGGKLFLVAGGTLYKSDGTPEGTVPVLGVSDSVYSVREVNGTVYFIKGRNGSFGAVTLSKTTAAEDRATDVANFTGVTSMAGFIGVGGASKLTVDGLLFTSALGARAAA